MALAFFEEGPVSLDPRTALHVPIGAASPLWLLFAGAATSGMAYWWMTRWALRTNLEAVLAPPVPVESEIEPAVELETEVMIPAAQLVAEPAEAIEEAAELTSPLIEALAEPEPPPVELAPEPKPKPKIKPPVEPPSEL